MSAKLLDGWTPHIYDFLLVSPGSCKSTFHELAVIDSWKKKLSLGQKFLTLHTQRDPGDFCLNWATSSLAQRLSSKGSSWAKYFLKYSVYWLARININCTWWHPVKKRRSLLTHIFGILLNKLTGKDNGSYNPSRSVKHSQPHVNTGRPCTPVYGST